MTSGLVSGIALLGFGLLMIYMGRPDKAGDCPRYLRFHAAPMLYPPFVLAFLVGGIAQLFISFY